MQQRPAERELALLRHVVCSFGFVLQHATVLLVRHLPVVNVGHHETVCFDIKVCSHMVQVLTKENFFSHPCRQAIGFK